MVNENNKAKTALSDKCKVIKADTAQITKEAKFQIKENDIESQNSISCCQKELVANVSLLCKSTQINIRVMTNCALKNASTIKYVDIENDYQIVGQEFTNDKTIFVFKKTKEEGERRMFAHELYAKQNYLKRFNFNDLINIVHTAVQEQTIEDIGWLK